QSFKSSTLAWMLSKDAGRLCPVFSYSPSCFFWARPGSAGGHSGILLRGVISRSKQDERNEISFRSSILIARARGGKNDEHCNHGIEQHANSAYASPRGDDLSQRSEV